MGTSAWGTANIDDDNASPIRRHCQPLLTK
jgi:hypothetical protein